MTQINMASRGVMWHKVATPEASGLRVDNDLLFTRNRLVGKAFARHERRELRGERKP